MKRYIKAAVLCLVLALCLAGCGSAGQTQSVSESSAAAEDDMFTERDLSGTWDEKEAEKITLSGESVTISEEGTYLISGTLTDGQILVDADETAKIQLVLDGVTIENGSLPAIYAKQADKVFLTLAEGSENTLSVTGAMEADGETNTDAAIFSKEDLCINGSGSLTISSSGNGITSKDDLKVTGGDITIRAEGHGLEGKDSVRIAGGTFAVTSGKDAIHADNAEEEGKGYVYIRDGSFTISAVDDACHAAGNLTVEGGEIAVSSCYEGMEGHTIDILGGTIDITSSDDAFNAAGGNDGSGNDGDPFATDTEAYLSIEGGTITVNCIGDGLDSNGSLYVSGGTIFVAGPENAGNGAVDYNGEGKITGGTLIATGMSGMAMNFGEGSTQGAMLLSSGSAVTGTVSVTDSAGKELVSFDLGKNYDSVLISTPELAAGETYTVTLGSVSSTVEMTSLIMGQGGGMGGPGGGQPPGQ